MFEAKGILLEEIKAMDSMNDATAAGRGYGVAGGSGCSFLITLAVATIGVSALLILSMVSGKNFLASICPFGAIADKSQIFQLIRAMQSGRKIIAQVAPAFVGQFGSKVTPDMLKTALKELGFYFDAILDSVGYAACHTIPAPRCCRVIHGIHCLDLRLRRSTM